MIMKTRLLALALAAFSAVANFAASPLGTFVYDFSVTNAPVWDLSGPLELNQQIIGVAGSGIQLSVPVTMDQSIKGRLDGSGFTTLTVDTNVITGRYRVEGKVYTAASKTKVKLTVRASGRDVIAGVTNTFKIVLVYKLELDPETQQLTGTVRGTARFSQLRGGRVHQDVTVALPAGNDGSWTLTLDLNSTTPPGGNAEITLPNGRFLPYAVRGKYSSSTDSTKLTLSGFGNSRGSKLTLRVAGTNALLTELRGRVFGQKLKHPASPPPSPNPGPGQAIGK
jgi:hypothetical protein